MYVLTSWIITHSQYLRGVSLCKLPPYLSVRVFSTIVLNCVQSITNRTDKIEQKLVICNIEFSVAINGTSAHEQLCRVIGGEIRWQVTGARGVCLHSWCVGSVLAFENCDPNKKNKIVPCSIVSVIISSSYAFFVFLPVSLAQFCQTNVISSLLHHRRFAVRRGPVWYPGYTSGNTSLRRDLWDGLTGPGKISKWRQNSI